MSTNTERLALHVYGRLLGKLVYQFSSQNLEKVRQIQYPGESSKETPLSLYGTQQLEQRVTFLGTGSPLRESAERNRGGCTFRPI